MCVAKRRKLDSVFLFSFTADQRKNTQLTKMAEEDVPDPKRVREFGEYQQMLNYQFEQYRESGRDVNGWTKADMLEARNDYLAKAFPAPGRPRKFVAERWTQRPYRSSFGRRIDIDGPLDEYEHDEEYPRLLQIQDRNESFQRWFGSKSVEQNLLDCHRHHLHTRH